MSCDPQIHDELKNMKKLTCPFCDKQLTEVDSIMRVIISCCENQNMIKYNKGNICQNCGAFHGYDYANEFIDYYENMHKIRRKSVYYRKYHLYNKIDFLMNANKYNISYNDREKIIKIFNEINAILPEINQNRKRIININFLLKNIFIMLGLPYNDIPITKSKKTLEFYNRYWVEILLLIFDKIIRIVNQ